MVYRNTEELFSEIAIELGLKESTRKRFMAFDPESGAKLFFSTMEEMVAWVRS